jgi:urease accessory protein
VLGATVLSLVLAPALALAHTSDSTTSGLLAGMAHPWTGIDHVAAMLAAGLWAGRMRRRSIAALFAATSIGIVCGALLGAYTDVVTFAELIVAVSVVVFGVLAAGMGYPRVLLAAALIAVFAFFHGYAHAVEMPRQFSQVAFTMGFLISMLTLQLSGVLLASALSHMGHARLIT